jgi:hypothetical protein
MDFAIGLIIILIALFPRTMGSEWEEITQKFNEGRARYRAKHPARSQKEVTNE